MALAGTPIAASPVAGIGNPIGIDGWGFPQSQPYPALRRTAQSEGWFAIPPPAMIPTAVEVAGQSADPFVVQSFQYDDFVQPLVPMEVLTLNIKWESAWPDPYFPAKRLIQYGVNCAIAEQADNGLPPVYWIPPTDQPLNRLPPMRANGFSIGSPLPLPNAAAAMFISGQSADPFAIQGFQYDDLAAPVVPIAAPETITVDKWWQEASRPRWSVKVADPGWPAIDPKQLTVVERTTPDKWWQEASKPVWAVRRAVAEGWFTIDPSQLTQKEFVSFDRWNFNQERPRWDLKRTAHLAPVVVSDDLFQIPGVETITIDKWKNYAPDQFLILRRAVAEGLSIIDPTQLTQKERITLDKWWRELSRPPEAVKRSPAVGWYILDPSQMTAPERASLDKWWQEASRPRWSVRRAVDEGLSIIDLKELTQKEAVSFDRWNFNQERPRWDVRRWQFLWPSMGADDPLRGMRIIFHPHFIAIVGSNDRESDVNQGLRLIIVPKDNRTT